MVLTWIAWGPPLLALAWSILFRVGIPEPAEWIWARAEDPLPFDAAAILATPEYPAYLAFRAAFVGLLQLGNLGVGFEWLNLSTFVTALLAFLISRQLLRRLLRETSPTRWIGEVLISAWLFHPSWGMHWLLVGRFREFVPVLAFVAALATIHGKPGAERGSWNRRWWLALAWILVAQAGHGTGLLAWLAVGPAVWLAARRDAVMRPGRSAVMLVGLAGLAQVILWAGLREMSFRGFVSYLCSQPKALVSMLGSLTAETLPVAVLPGFAVIQGGAVLALVCLTLLAAAIRHRRLEAADGVCASLCLFGLLTLLMTTDRFFAERPHYGQVPPESVRESLLGMGTILAGSFGLWRRLVPRLWSATHGVILGGCLVLLARDWHSGFEHLKFCRSFLRAEAAELCIEEVAPDLTREPMTFTKLESAILAPGTLADLRRRGLLASFPRLPGIDLASGYPTPSDSVGVFHGLVGGKLCGELRGTTLRPTPGMTFLVRVRGDERRVVGLLRSQLRRGLKRTPIEGRIPDRSLLRDGDRLCAVALEIQPLGLHPLAGVFQLASGTLKPLEGSDR